MSTPTVGRAVGHGALAGAVAGLAGAAIMYFLVEPSIKAAIAIEEASTKASEAAGHVHMSDEIVTRGEQVAFGLLTVLVVSTLIGVAFALVLRSLGRRLTDRDGPGAAMTAAGLGFLCFTLAPALVIPANPPSVGDPATVDARTLTYIGTIVCALALTTLVVAASRARGLSPRNRVLAATALGVLGVLVLRFAIPDTSSAIPADVPADLIWKFRLGSLAEIGSMWLVMAAAYGWLSAAPTRSGVPADPVRTHEVTPAGNPPRA